MGIVGSFLRRRKRNNAANGSGPASASSTPPGWKKGTFDNVTYNYKYIKPAEGKATFLLLHGFPNGPANYETFIPELTSEGYGIVLPELLGYGETDKPTEVEAYAFKPMCKQIKGILDAEGVEKVIGLGHDFGAPLIARFSQFYPDTVTAIVLGGASYTPPSPTPMDVKAILAVLAPALGYENIGYFSFFAADHAPKTIDDHLESFLSIMFGPPADWKEHLCKTGGLESRLNENKISKYDDWVTKEAREAHFAYLKKNGLAGPCMWFRAAVSPVNIGDHKTLDPRVKHPYLYISPSEDPSVPLAVTSRQNVHCDDITTEKIQTGHWIFEQKPKESAQIVLKWVKEKGLV